MDSARGEENVSLGIQRLSQERLPVGNEGEAQGP